jgi:hypothetical protein
VSRLSAGSKVVSLTHRPRSSHYFSASGIQFCRRLDEPQSLVRPQGLGKLKEFIYLIRSQTHGLPVCSILPQPLLREIFRDFWKKSISNTTFSLPLYFLSFPPVSFSFYS